MSTKTCSRCKIEKPVERFGARPGCRDGLKGVCKDCCTIWQVARYRKDPEKYKARNRELGSVPKSRFSRFKKRCVYAGKEFKLSFEDWCGLVLNKCCHYCDGPLENKGCALDRKDNSVGYTITNVVPCCKECNRIKGPTLTYLEMLCVAEVLKEMRAR